MSKLERVLLVINVVGGAVGIWATVDERRQARRDQDQLEEKDAIINGMAERIAELERQLRRKQKGRR